MLPPPAAGVQEEPGGFGGQGGAWELGSAPRSPAWEAAF